MHKIVCDRALPGHARGAYSTPPDPLATSDGTTSKSGGVGRGGTMHTLWIIPSYDTANKYVVLTVVKYIHQSTGVLQNVKPDEKLWNTVVGKCCNGIDVGENTVTSSTATCPDVTH